MVTLEDIGVISSCIYLVYFGGLIGENILGYPLTRMYLEQISNFEGVSVARKMAKSKIEKITGKGWFHHNAHIASVIACEKFLDETSRPSD